MNTTRQTAVPWQKLLGRAPTRLEPRISKHFEGTTVLITGAGGSIGSALAKAVLECRAEEVILLDSSEQALYRIASELSSSRHTVPILGSILDERLLNEVFDQFAPAFVFHTAAFKHLPLLEAQPFAAIENNAIGTYVLAKSAEKFRARRLVAVSTDKAVNPTSVMGASKRMAELVIASFAKSRTRMTTVRLGNVLGSDGSVAPRFVEQIQRGGPITITDPAATRYFFAMEETVDLILFGSTGDAENATIIPNQPEPTSVLILAESLIRALDANHIEMEYTGLHAGEKTTEQLCYDYELQNVKQLDGCRLIPNQPARLDVERMIADLRLSILERDFDLLMQTVRQYVPEYCPSAQLQQLFGTCGTRSRA